jgi:hypothetical protein
MQINDEVEYMSVKRAANQLSFGLVVCERFGLEALQMMLFDQMPKETASLFVAGVTEAAIKEHLGQLNVALSIYDWTFHRDRRGDWMPLFSGRRFWPQDPRPGDIDIVDIAHALARINRFNGHTLETYSVAQHCVLVSQNVPLGLRLFALFHDAGESYLGDLITPVKRLFRAFYDPVEQKVMDAVAAKFGFTMTTTEKALVKRADTALLMTEIRDLTPCGVVPGVITEAPLVEHITTCLSPADAEAYFLARLKELTHA